MNFYQLYEFTKHASIPKLHLSWDEDVSTFKSWLMSEVTKDISNELEKWATDNPEELPFSDIFKGQNDQPITRTIIPFDVNPYALSILKKIKDVGLTINFNSGTVSNGNRIVRLGKYILNKKSIFNDKEKEWWNTAGQAIDELKSASIKDQYAIVVSRNPIDIVRMSDHDGWTSCHAPHREYFKCALSDAKGAGAIAYVVKKEDLNKVDLQASEIFKDKKRYVDGVVPVSRVRLRKFVHDDDNFDLAIPEDRTYGQKFPGLEDSVRKWAFQSQIPKLEKHGYGTPEEWENGKKQRPRMRDFKLMGGSYQDTTGGKLFNYFFNDELDYGDAEYGGEDEYQNMVDQMETEVALIEREYRNAFNICSYYASVEDGDGEPYVSYGGNIHLEIPEELMVQTKEELMVQTKHDWKKVREAVRKWAKDNDIYTINNVEVNGNEVNISVYDEDGFNPDSLRGFLDDLRDIDKRANELKAGLYHLFIELGIAKPNKVNYINNNWDDHPHQFTHFKWEGGEPDVIISLAEPITLPSATKTASGYQHEYKYWQQQFSNALIKELNMWADRVVAVEKQQPSLFPDFVHKPKRAFSGEFKIVPNISITPGNTMWQHVGTQNKEKMFMNMSLEFEVFSTDANVEDAIDFIAFLDKNYDKFVLLVQNIYNKVWVANWGKAQPQQPVDLTGMTDAQKTAALNQMSKNNA